MEALPNTVKLAALHQDADWQPPLFDVWTAARKQGEHLTRRDEILKALGLRADQSNKGQTGKYADVTGDNLSPVKTAAEIVRCVAALDERKQRGGDRKSEAAKSKTSAEVIDSASPPRRPLTCLE